jgi:gluconate/galactonate dehydratase
MVDGSVPWTLVRADTDAGVVGTGEALWGAGVPELVERTTPFLLGENPLDVDRLAAHLVQRMSGEGSIAGPTVTAISGLALVLHDLAGRPVDVPASQLLGGNDREEVRVDGDCHAGEAAEPAANADQAERVVEERGDDALEFDLDVPSGHDRDRPNRHLRPAESRGSTARVRRGTRRLSSSHLGVVGTVGSECCSSPPHFTALPEEMRPYSGPGLRVDPGPQ